MVTDREAFYLRALPTMQTMLGGHIMEELVETYRLTRREEETWG
ncbi:MAG: hypothetical protein SOR61_01615 [Evtepia sp.]|nr:hypothetical protein [Evtepia sp.]MDY3013895.1 hypothetical protein [Evtepia sp.]